MCLCVCVSVTALRVLSLLNLWWSLSDWLTTERPVFIFISVEMRTLHDFLMCLMVGMAASVTSPTDAFCLAYRRQDNVLFYISKKCRSFMTHSIAVRSVHFFVSYFLDKQLSVLWAVINVWCDDNRNDVFMFNVYSNWWSSDQYPSDAQ